MRDASTHGESLRCVPDSKSKHLPPVQWSTTPPTPLASFEEHFFPHTLHYIAICAWIRWWVARAQMTSSKQLHVFPRVNICHNTTQTSSDLIMQNQVQLKTTQSLKYVLTQWKTIQLHVSDQTLLEAFYLSFGLNWFLFGWIGLYFWLNFYLIECSRNKILWIQPHLHRQPIINEELSCNKTKSEKTSNETRAISKLKVKSITEWKQLQMYLQLSTTDWIVEQAREQHRVDLWGTAVETPNSKCKANPPSKLTSPFALTGFFLQNHH